MIDFYDVNARHEAAIVWGTLLLVYICVTPGPARRSLLACLKSIMQPLLAVSICGLLANTVITAVLSVWLGRQIGLWQTFPVIAMMIWFVSAGFSLLLDFGEHIRNNDELPKRHIKALVPSTVLNEIAAFAILPFWWEILLTPVLMLAVILWLAGKSSGHRGAGGFLLSAYGICLVVIAINRLVVSPENWPTVVQGVLLPLMLAVMTIPYLQLLIIAEKFQFVVATKSRTVRSEEYGPDWPLTVDAAKLCYRSGGVWVEANGKRYWLNGWARQVLAARGYDCLTLHEIWRDVPSDEILDDPSRSSGDSVSRKVSIYRLLADGLTLERKR